MTSKWISDARQRRSANYKRIHDALRREAAVEVDNFSLHINHSEQTKAERRKAKHAAWRQNGAP